MSSFVHQVLADMEADEDRVEPDTHAGLDSEAATRLRQSCNPGGDQQTTAATQCSRTSLLHQAFAPSHCAGPGVEEPYNMIDDVDLQGNFLCPV